MTWLRIVTRSLAYHWRIHATVALGVAASTAVLTGALVVGDSVRGSLKHLALDRLGRIEEVVLADHLFPADLAERLEHAPGFSARYSAAVPIIVLEGTVQNASQRRALAGGVHVLASNERFWKLGDGGPKRQPGRDQIVLNESLAREIDAHIGDEVLLRLGQASQIPSDSPLGRKTETVRTSRLAVSEIIPALGLARFALRPNQRQSLNAFVGLATLERALEQPGKVNALAIAGTRGADDAGRADGPTADEPSISQLLRPRLADYGLILERTGKGYVNLTSRRMILEPAAEAAASRALAEYRLQPALTYLANSIRAAGSEIPYSTVTAVDFEDAPPLGPWKLRGGGTAKPLADAQIALNTWAADDIRARVGDQIEMTYFEAESTHGQVRERTAHFRLAAIVELDGAAADPDFTPKLPGITDQLSMGDWDPPFPFQANRVRPKDEQYWNQRRTTPKAFVSLSTGRKLWASRFGRTTSIRVAAPPEVTPEQLAERIKLEPTAMGFSIMPVRRAAFEAAQGTTPFNVLFLAFSMFIIAAALSLVALLFQLGIDQRAAEIGTLLAAGMRNRRLAMILGAEALVVSIIGGLVGVAGGIAYAHLMLAALRTWWLAAVSTPLIDLWIEPRRLAFGFALGTAVSMLTIFVALRRLRRVPVRRLLAGEGEEAPVWHHGRRRAAWSGRLGVLLLIVAVATTIGARRLGGEAQIGAFFGAGAAVLVASLLLLRARIARGADAPRQAARFSLAALAARNAERNPRRTILTTGVVAAACFVIVAMSAFQIDPGAAGGDRSSGSGGFALLAESDQPIFQNPGTPLGREELGIDQATGAVLKDVTVYPLRVQPGDDASCLNLYRPTQPRMLGVTRAFAERGGFAWQATAGGEASANDNPWRLLDETLAPEEAGVACIPIVLDANTAMYSLHLWRGVGESFEIRDGSGQKLRLKIVGLLKNSIFQGDVLVSERNLLVHFPNVSGYRFFLIDAPPEAAAKVQRVLEEQLDSYGFDAQRAVDRLAGFLAVQNTYLSTFQSLGGLGLLLGTLGLAVVEMRSVVERRGELALLRAAGFRRSRLARLVLAENMIVLLVGLAIGIVAAAVALLPHVLGGGAGIPWRWLSITLIAVVVAGFAAALLAVRFTLRAKLLEALRAQ